MLDFLPVFGDEFGNPPEPCDYDGTPLEDLVIGIADGSIVLDSMFIEYEFEDVSTYYVLGCPDPVTDTLIFSNSVMLETFHSVEGFGYIWYRFLCQPLSFNSTTIPQLALLFILTNHTIVFLALRNDGFFGQLSVKLNGVPFLFLKTGT